MWVLTTKSMLVNIRDARKIEIAGDPDGRAATRVLLAHFADGDTATLARVQENDDAYNRAIAAACLKSISDALREEHNLCDLTGIASKI